MPNINIASNESITVTTTRAVSGGADGETPTFGSSDARSTEIHAGQGETITAFIGGQPAWTTEVDPVTGKNVTTFHGRIRHYGSDDLTPMPPNQRP